MFVSIIAISASVKHKPESNLAGFTLD